MSVFFDNFLRLIGQSQFEEAETMAETLERHEPAWIEAQRILAFHYFEARDLDNATVITRRVLEGSPNLPWALHLTVRIARGRSDVPGQMEGLDRLHILLPHDASVAQAYADLLNADGQPGKAEAVLRTAHEWGESDIGQLPIWQDDAAAYPPSRYLDLLEKTVCNLIYGDASVRGQEVADYAEDRRLVGRDLPTQAHTMIGMRRLHQLRRAVETIIDEGIMGDCIETGAWRGGACILMRGVLAERKVADRRIIVADSFEGLPPPDPRYAQDALTTFDFHKRPELAISVEAVRANFARYDLLDDQVTFLKGFFHDSLPTLPDRPLAILRLDGDLYSSTMDALEALYDRVSPGGFVIVDDYGPIIDCRRAILDFRASRNITSAMTAVDGDAVFWRKD